MGATRKVVDPLAAAIARELDAWRNKRELTLDEAGERAAMSGQTVWRIESLRSVADADQIARLARAYGTKPSTIVAAAEEAITVAEDEGSAPGTLSE